MARSVLGVLAALGTGVTHVHHWHLYTSTVNLEFDITRTPRTLGGDPHGSYVSGVLAKWKCPGSARTLCLIHGPTELSGAGGVEGGPQDRVPLGQLPLHGAGGQWFLDDGTRPEI